MGNLIESDEYDARIADRATAEQFARDYDWSDTSGRIEDPDYAAAEIIGQLGDYCAPELRGVLHAALVDSAERENWRRC